MPSATLGFTRQEIRDRIINYVGNTSTSFQTYVEQSIPLAEYRYCKMHDWSFLYKSGLSLTVTNGTAEYDLDLVSIGYYMAASDVETIRAEADGVVIKKLDLAQIRRLDPGNNDGSSSDTPIMWAPVGDNRIRFWPPSFETGAVKIDGKISPSATTTLNAYSVIPFRYQEGFIAYATSLALDRENDDRAAMKMQESHALIRQDIQDDMRNLGTVESARIKHLNEAREDGFTTTFDPFED